MSRSQSSLIAGLLLVIVGAVWVLNNIGATDFDFGDFIAGIWPVAIILVGVWLLIGGPKRKAKTPGASTGSTWFSQPVGDIELAPADIGEGGYEVKIGAGEIELDLRETRFADGENAVQARLGLGDIHIRAPRNLPLLVEGRTGIGDLRLLDRTADGFATRLEVEDPTYKMAQKKLRITASVGLGDIKVTRPA